MEAVPYPTVTMCALLWQGEHDDGWKGMMDEVLQIGVRWVAVVGAAVSGVGVVGAAVDAAVHTAICSCQATVPFRTVKLHQNADSGWWLWCCHSLVGVLNQTVLWFWLCLSGW